MAVQLKPLTTQTTNRKHREAVVIKSARGPAPATSISLEVTMLIKITPLRAVDDYLSGLTPCLFHHEVVTSQKPARACAVRAPPVRRTVRHMSLL